jgi:hypothetical protein
MKEFVLFLALANPVFFKLLRSVLGNLVANSYGVPTLVGLCMAAAVFVLLTTYVKVSNFNPFSADDWEGVGQSIEQDVGDPLISAYNEAQSGVNTAVQWIDQFGNSCAALGHEQDYSWRNLPNGPGPD